MTATFRVHATFELRSRGAFVLRGEVLGGSVRRGMWVHVPLNNGVEITVPISAVEAVDGPGFGAATVALVLTYDDSADRDVWRAWDLDGDALLVTESRPTDRPSAEPR